MDREAKIIRTSVEAIIVNILLVVFKMFVGFLSNSIAIILDAVNNLTDALSSVITIIGTKLAGKAPDKEHPFGYGRIEYMTSAIIGAIIFFAGFTAQQIQGLFKRKIHCKAGCQRDKELYCLSSTR